VTASSVQSQYSSSVSPFQANTGVPVLAIAAAAWSWVEKMLQDAQRTSAPRSLSVSISTAVWMVMCSEPVTRTPLSGWAAAYLRRMDIRPGISCSAMSISLRPQSARDRSATLKSCFRFTTAFMATPKDGRARFGMEPEGPPSLIPRHRAGTCSAPRRGGGRALYRRFAMEG